MRRKRFEALEAFNEKGYDRLATYNGERDRGLVHTPEYQAEMAAIQQRFNAERRAEALANGWVLIGGGGSA